MADYRSILRQYWGYNDFRGIQKDIIDSIGNGNDTLGLMPTGGGKSITFQVPALAMEGVCLVITPLIALMKDQVQHLRERGIMAAAIYSGMTRPEIITTLENCIFGQTKLLYISPERLSSELFQTKLKHIRVSFITVDEAHCISQWGYDFRPSYLHISDIRQLKPNVPILALTATATPEVVDDIQEQLGFRAKNVFSMSFERKNLTYVVRNTLDKDKEMIHILESVEGSAIVYVRSRKRTKEIAELLETNDIPSTFYHAGLSHSTKDIRQQRWHDDQTRVMVATNAFGMGIDKPDVRIVIHYDSPDSIEAYFQEAGRAGRDGNRAYAVLLWDNRDNAKLIKRVDSNFPPKDYILKVYDDLACYYQIGAGSGYGHTFRFEIEKFCHNFHHYPLQAHSALTILSRAQYIEYELNPESRARVMFLLSRNELYKLDELTKQEDAVVTTLLRLHGCLFTDYAYIDLSLIAQFAETTPQEVYNILKSMSQRHILHFIPESKTPYITYTREREVTEHMTIPKEVYEDRKEQFAKRINAMIAYANETDTCRSRVLLQYFGEEHSKDCQRCDVCLANSTIQTAESRIKPIEQQIIDLLADGKQHGIEEISKIPQPLEKIGVALQALADEEVIRRVNDKIALNAT